MDKVQDQLSLLGLNLIRAYWTHYFGRHHFYTWRDDDISCIWLWSLRILSGITAGSPMSGTPIILVRRPINPGLIKDLWIMPLRPKTSEMAKEQERKVESPGIEPRAIGIPCHCSTTRLQLPPATTPLFLYLPPQASHWDLQLSSMKCQIIIKSKLVTEHLTAKVVPVKVAMISLQPTVQSNSWDTTQA